MNRRLEQDRAHWTSKANNIQVEKQLIDKHLASMMVNLAECRDKVANMFFKPTPMQDVALQAAAP